MSSENYLPLFPSKRTAFIIIHGVGEQSPYETIDFFARNFLKYFENSKIKIQLEHLITPRKRYDGSQYLENFVRISQEHNQDESLIDIHEYYWAANTENKISVPEVLNWAEKTLQGTIEFYNRPENKPLLEKLLRDKKWQSLFRFRLRWVTILLRLFNIFYPILRLVTWAILYLLNPFLSGSFLQPARELSKKIVTPFLVNLVGDVAIYTTTDVKSEYQSIRQSILVESANFVQEILQDNLANYDQVILVGHSLGSCIAYDTLNDLIVTSSLDADKISQKSLQKITGLITFGSPLDKMAFFFREMVPQDQFIRQRILRNLQTFRVKQQIEGENLSWMKNPVLIDLPQVKWVNYYHLQDPISGNLDYYENLKNIRMEYSAKWGQQAHIGYWSHPSFYESIVQAFFSQELDKSQQ
ncbi:P2 GpE family protein [Calothrix sp. 336/3]|uniref:P2 GpE family protein n=1 Tax=Calothrix sp. 336/3 TaxID=1337936 RepID=UPI0004E3BC12|nr:P2 GpE family protein [Calothrix sp. 336/3]AKG20049.1 P2 GpE family protein [Calothrix sp. 336/3]